MYGEREFRNGPAIAPAIDGLIFAAGVALVRHFSLTDAPALRRVLAVNVEGLLLLRDFSRARGLEQGAAVVFFGSIFAHRETLGDAAYCAINGALVVAVCSLSLEIAGTVIWANVFSSGLVQTAMEAELGGQISDEQLKA